MKRKIIYILIFLVCINLFFASFIFAQELPNTEMGGEPAPEGPEMGGEPANYWFLPNFLRFGTFEDLVNEIAYEIYRFGIVLAVIMIIISGVQFMTSGGNEEKIKTAKRNLTYSVVGVVIIILARSLILVIKDFFGF